MDEQIIGRRVVITVCVLRAHGLARRASRSELSSAVMASVIHIQRVMYEFPVGSPGEREWSGAGHTCDCD